jgi:hypothetical protein
MSLEEHLPGGFSPITVETVAGIGLGPLGLADVSGWPAARPFQQAR